MNELTIAMEKLEPLSVKEQHLENKKSTKSVSKEEFHKGFGNGVTEAFK